MAAWYDVGPYTPEYVYHPCNSLELDRVDKYPNKFQNQLAQNQPPVLQCLWASSMISI